MISAQNGSIRNGIMGWDEPFLTDIMDRMMCQLVLRRQRRRGRRGNPEPPTLIAKYHPAAGRAEVYLGGTPTVSTVDDFRRYNLSLQVHCYSRHPSQVQLDDGNPSTRGAAIPGCVVVRLEMSHHRHRLNDLRAVLPLMARSLACGDNIYIHCMTGLSRGPLGAAILIAALNREPLDTAIRRIDSLRNTKLGDALQSMGGPWIEAAIGTQIDRWWPCHFYVAEHNRNNMAHASVKEGDDYFPLCKWKQGERTPFAQPGNKFPPLFANSSLLGIRSYACRFCRACQTYLCASLQVEVDALFSTT